MRKFTFVLAAAMFFASTLFAYEQIGSLNPYAYNVSAAATDSTVTVSYNLNAPAVSTEIAIYCNGVEMGTQAVEDNAVGAHSAVIDLAPYTQGGKYTVGIRVFGNSYDAPFQLKEIRDNSTDTTALCYSFYHPKGVAVDRNPFSPYFGRILTDETMEDTPDIGYHSSADRDGIYAFDATFSPIPNGNSMAYKGGLNFSVRMSDGSTRAYTPYRIVISKDNRIFVSMQDDKISPLYEVSPDLQTWTPIFSGDVSDGVIRDAEGRYVSGINCGLDVKGEGEDLEIIMLNTNRSGMWSYDGKGFMIATYKLGTKTAWTGPATTADTLAKIVGEGVVPSVGNCGIAYDNVEGYWYIGNRPQAIEQRSLVHVNGQKMVDWAISEQDSALFKLNQNGLNGGGNARIIDDMLILGGGQHAIWTGHLIMLDIKHGENNVPILSPKYDVNLINISRNLNDFAIDFGHNLYTVGNSNEMIIPVALPYSGVVETPVNVEVEKAGNEGVENVQSGTQVHKIIRNGQLLILKGGKTYTADGRLVVF